MNRHITTTAERARTRIVAHRPIRTTTPPAVIPLPVLAGLWPWAPTTAPGPLAWRAWRWPLNTARALVARLWPRWWTGHRYPVANLAARLLFTLTGIGIGIAAVALAVVTTTVAVGLGAIGHLGGVLLILHGWSPPPSRRHLEAELAALTTTGPLPAVPTPATPPPATTNAPEPGEDPWDFNARNDPWLSLERARLDELRRYNNLLEADAHRPALAPGPTGPAPQRPLIRHRSRQPRGWRAVRALATVSILVGLVWFAATALLSAASAVGVGPQPPTFEQIHGSINQPTPTIPGTATSGTGS